MENVLCVGAATATTIKGLIIRWSEENRETLQPVIAENNSILTALRDACSELKDDLRSKLKTATEKVKDTVTIAKSNWARKKAESIHQMCHSLGKAWKVTKELITGDSCHHNKPDT